MGIYLEKESNWSPDVGHDLPRMWDFYGSQHFLEMYHAVEKVFYSVYVYQSIGYFPLCLNLKNVFLYIFVAA